MAAKPRLAQLPIIDWPAWSGDEPSDTRLERGIQLPVSPVNGRNA
ncbi:hypothetical protein XBLMG947_2200 [Xanthomonas bromi]|uniref:Uncharacterized protein n=1 Tax=Xanthomonas bromi TaxID=56449 RepID=A0A1C3NM17_9XANT|nr:hypothetical protein XBLMG947_2200 [Xanthomonas bromi]